MTEWKRYKTIKPEKSGDYLILYDDGNGGNGVSADVGHYYIPGEHITALHSDINGTAEEKLLDSIINHPVTVAKEGFYADDDMNFWELRPLFWAELPEAPEGHEYC